LDIKPKQKTGSKKEFTFITGTISCRFKFSPLTELQLCQQQTLNIALLLILFHIPPMEWFKLCCKNKPGNFSCSVMWEKHVHTAFE